MAKRLCAVLLGIVIFCSVWGLNLAVKPWKLWKRGRGFPVNKSREFDNAETELLKDIMKGYNRFARPAVNASDKVTVQFSLQLTNLGGVDFKWHTLSANFWMYQVWQDFRLTWDPADYDGVNVIRIPPSYLWKPDITLYNNYGNQYSEDGLVLVYNDGTCLWVPHIRFIALCNYDLSKFPYDNQLCMFRFGSWTYTDLEIVLEEYIDPDKPDLNAILNLENFRGNQEWKISKVNETIDVKHYPCCTEGYPTAVVWISLKRVSTVHTYIFTTPCILLTFLIPFVFLLPEDSKQKIQLGIGIMVSLTLLLLMLLMTMPAAFANPPIIGVFIVSSMVLVTFSILLTAVTSGLWTNITKREMHAILRRIFLDILGKALCVDRGAYSMMTSGANSMDAGYTKDTQNLDTADTAAVLSVPQVSEAIAREWQAFFVVMDRLLFLIFLVVSIVVAIIFSV